MVCAPRRAAPCRTGSSGWSACSRKFRRSTGAMVVLRLALVACSKPCKGDNKCSAGQDQGTRRSGASATVLIGRPQGNMHQGSHSSSHTQRQGRRHSSTHLKTWVNTHDLSRPSRDGAYRARVISECGSGRTRERGPPAVAEEAAAGAAAVADPLGERLPPALPPARGLRCHPPASPPRR